MSLKKNLVLGGQCPSYPEHQKETGVLTAQGIGPNVEEEGVELNTTKTRIVLRQKHVCQEPNRRGPSSLTREAGLSPNKEEKRLDLLLARQDSNTDLLSDQ